jgi:hypothetical protein
MLFQAKYCFLTVQGAANVPARVSLYLHRGQRLLKECAVTGPEAQTTSHAGNLVHWFALFSFRSLLTSRKLFVCLSLGLDDTHLETLSTDHVESDILSLSQTTTSPLQSALYSSTGDVEDDVHIKFLSEPSLATFSCLFVHVC